MKKLVVIAVFAVAQAQAAPFLLADPYPLSGVQPSSAELTINGGAAQLCTLVQVSGGLSPQCDLAAVVAPGNYTLVMTVRSVASCTGNTCGGGGSASSDPFVYQWTGANVAVPAVRLAP